MYKDDNNVESNKDCWEDTNPSDSNKLFFAAALTKQQ